MAACEARKPLGFNDTIRSRFRAVAAFLLFGVAPVFLGGLLYIAFRPTDLLLFAWAEQLGLSELTFAIRTRLEGAPTSGFVVGSAPAGLWSLSMSSIVALVWPRNEPPALYWLLAAAMLGPGSEFLQAVGVLSGTFDLLDMLAYCGGSFLGVAGVRIFQDLFIN